MSGPVVGKTYAEGEGPPGNWRSWLIWGTAAVFYLYEFLVRVAPSVMERELQQVYAVSAGTFGLAVGVYYYVYAPMQIAVGLLLDKWGVKRVLVPAAVFCCVGCLLTMAVPNVWVFALGRALMGFGSAFAFVGCMHLATVWFPSNRIALLSGLTTTLGMAGAIAAQRPLVELLDVAGWRGSWVVCGAFGLIIAVLMWIIIPKPPPWEAAASDAEVDEEARTVWRGLKEVAMNPQSWIIGFIGTALFFNLSVFGALWGDDYVMKLTGTNRNGASTAISMLYLGWLVGGPIAGHLSDRLERRKTVLIVSLILTAVVSGFLLLFNSMILWHCSVLLFILGAVSSAQVITFVTGLEHNPEWASATAIAFNNMVIMLIGGIFQPIVGLILDDLAGGGKNAEFTVADYRIALAMMPAFCVVALFVSFFLKESYGIKEETYEALGEE